MYTYLFIVTVLFGLIMGSFTNVMIYRIPEKISLWTPPSTCGSCNKQIKWYDNIPVLSFVLLGGKCRFCKSHISYQYPIIELLCGVVFAAIYLVYGFSLDLLFIGIISIILVAVSVIDFKSMIIPNGLVISLLVTGVIYSAIRFTIPEMFSWNLMWYDPLIGFFSASLPLFLIAVLSKGGMGGGDIKLMAAAGIFLGWKGIFVALLAGSLTGAVISIILMIAKKKGRKDMIPFGPFLCLGIMIAVLYAPQLLDWYLGLFIR